MNYHITKRTLLDCAELRKLQVAELEAQQLEGNGPFTKRDRGLVMFNPSVAVAQFQNGAAPVTKLLPIALMAKWAKLSEEEGIAITFTDRGVQLECGGYSIARAHFYEPPGIVGNRAFHYGDCGPPLRLVAASNTFDLETRPDPARSKELCQQGAKARKRAALAKVFARLKANFKNVHAHCRSEANGIRDARKVLASIPPEAAVALSRRIRAIRRLVRAMLKPPFAVPSWAAPDHALSIHRALEELRIVKNERDSYAPPKRYDKWTVRGARSLGISPARYAQQQCEKYGNPRYLLPHEVRGPKWQKLREAVEREERHVRGVLEHALRAHLASQGWHREAAYGLVSWSHGWQEKLCGYSRARVLVRRWPDRRRELAQQFNDAFHDAKAALTELRKCQSR